MDPAKKLKTIDVFLGDAKDKVKCGIYVINGDVRKSCFTGVGQRSSHGIPQGKGFMIIEWRQVK